MVTTARNETVDRHRPKETQRGVLLPDNMTRLSAQRHRPSKRKTPILAGVVVAGSFLAATPLAALSSDANQLSHSPTYHPVTRGDLAIAITTQGCFESQENVKILCEVDDVPGDDVYGTPILGVIPNANENGVRL